MAQSDLPSFVHYEQDGENPDSKSLAEPRRICWPNTLLATKLSLSCEDLHEESPVFGDDPQLQLEMISHSNLHNPKGRAFESGLIESG